MTSSFIGRTLGKYQLVQLLAQGGMAKIYKAYHSELDRYIAIKVLPPHPGRDPEFDERFRLEAHTVAHLQHPNILSLYDYGTEDDILYLAMAYVEGGSLSDLLAAGPLPIPRAEQILREVGSALDYAHRRGVIHRDIKPANILLDGEGHALLTDFGIAKIVGSASNITGTGGVIGTPAYMAPEQSQAQPIDQRADIYSLGIVLYEMLAGEQPYTSTNPVRVIIKHINDPIPRVTDARPDLPAAVEVVMQRALAKLPAERYQQVRDFYEAFSQALRTDLPAELHTTLTAADPAERAPAAQPTIILDAQNAPPAAAQTPSVYTFLFTAVEGSTSLWEQYPEGMSAALEQHDAVIAQAVEAYDGAIFKTTGDGVCAVFHFAEDALQAALTIQRRLFQEVVSLPLAVRIGLHTGMAEARGSSYFGPTLNRAARLLDAAHGGQILLSGAARDRLPSAVDLRDLGMHRLRDVPEPVRIFQAVSAEFPLNARPIRSLTPRPTNLPAQLTSFVGREENVREIAQLLRQADLRLLTLVGPGGIGKTRLCLQVGQSLLDEYEDGVFFVPLAPLNQPDAMAKALAQALNIEEDAATPLPETLKAHLQTRQTLLIFDNFEHLLEAAPLLNDLLMAAARVKILVTSRELLFIYGERTYSVPPLALPEAGDPPAQMLRSSAARLFVERAQAIQPAFALNEENAADVAAICRQLDGLPLALELAAARVHDLSLPEIAAQLTQRLGLLSKGPRDLPARQQTMRGAVEWSYQLLSGDEQQVFARLAVFEGPFFVEAGQAITGAADLMPLLRKSLVQQPADGVLTLLAVLREYALERLAESGEEAALRQQHGLYYCRWIEAAQEDLTGRDQISGFNRVKVEQYNLRAALEWFLRQGEFESAGRMVSVLWRYWATQSLLSEGRHWSAQVLAHADGLSPLIHARVAQGAGRLALLLHDYAGAAALQRQSLGLYQTAGDLPGQAAVLMSLGETAYVQGHLVEAENHFGASLSLFRALDHKAGIGRCLNSMGKIIMQSGDYAKAEPLLRESLALARDHGSSEAVALALYDLAGVLRAQQKYPEAEDFYRESLTLYRALDFAVGVATLLANLGFTLQGRGDQAAAREHFIEALRLLQGLDEPVSISECLIGLAGVLLASGQRERCVETLSAANALLTSVDAQEQLDSYDQAQYARLYAATHAATPEWKAAWDSGQSAPLDQIIRRLLEEAPAAR